jgi:hypothetical protein
MKCRRHVAVSTSLVSISIQSSTLQFCRSSFWQASTAATLSVKAFIIPCSRVLVMYAEGGKGRWDACLGACSCFLFDSVDAFLGDVEADEGELPAVEVVLASAKGDCGAKEAL